MKPMNEKAQGSQFLLIMMVMFLMLFIFSTLFIKQHYVYDAISATIIAYGAYFALNYSDIKAKINERTKVVVQANEK